MLLGTDIAIRGLGWPSHCDYANVQCSTIVMVRRTFIQYHLFIFDVIVNHLRHSTTTRHRDRQHQSDIILLRRL